MHPSFKKKLGICLLLLSLAVLYGILQGSVRFSILELLQKQNQPILFLRIMRIATAIVAGSGLAVSGIVLQAILRNALAEPYLLGTSSGAGIGAVTAVLLGLTGIYAPMLAFLGALLSIFIVYILAKQNNRIDAHSLILSGVIVSVAFSAVIVLILSLSSNEALHSMVWWLWGSFQLYDPALLIAVALIVFLGITVIYFFSQDLNAISIGEEEALHLGIEVETIKKILILVTSLMTACIVCVCGIIGFVGLIIPHMMRLLIGPNHKLLIPFSCVSASIFMVVCDTLSRGIFPPLEIPIGVITALLGAPAFILLLKRSQKIS